MKIGKWGLVVAGMALFLTAGLIGFYESLPTEPQNKLAHSVSGEPEPRAIIFQQGSRVCHQCHLACETEMEAVDLTPQHNLPVLPLADILTYYPSPEWSVAEDGHKLYITKLQQGLCEAHQKVRHLGVNSSGDYVAVYYGPSVVGNQGGVYQVLDLRLEGLEQEHQQKIRQGYFEIYSDDELLGILDSFSEME